MANTINVLTQREANAIGANYDWLVTSSLHGNHTRIWDRPQRCGTVFIGQWDRQTQTLWDELGTIRFHGYQVIDQSWPGLTRFNVLAHYNSAQTERLKAQLRIQARMVAIHGENRTISIP